jgi:hypothetical protein
MSFFLHTLHKQSGTPSISFSSSVCLPVHLSACLYLSVCVSVCLSLSICLSLGKQSDPLQFMSFFLHTLHKQSGISIYVSVYLSACLLLSVYQVFLNICLSI